MVYTWFEAPHHEWLQVPRKEVEELGILDKITAFSFVDEEFYYLEEDCDAPVFMVAKGLRLHDIPRYFIDDFPHKTGIKYIHSGEEIEYRPSPVEKIELPHNIEELMGYGDD